MEKGSREKKRTTLHRQISLVFMLVLAVSILVITVTNGIFLEKYYISQKVEVLQEAKEALEELQLGYMERAEESEISPDDEELIGDSSDHEFSGQKAVEWESLTDELGRTSSQNNLSWVVINQENSSGYSWGEHNGILRSKLFGYIYGLDSDIDKGDVIRKLDIGAVQKVHDHYVGMDYVECWGRLENGYYYLIRTPLESLRESAAISNKFYLFVGVATVIISGLFLMFLIRRLTRPISELTNLSQRMADLNFDARYESHAGNEIDVLGENFNRMSEQLEGTISKLKSANLELQKDIENKIRQEERRKEFLDNVSHELKTPIALVQGYAEGLKENITEDPESMEFYCDVIIDEAGKMNKLVKNLLTLNQLESGKDPVSMEHFDLIPLIQGVLSSMEIMIQQNEAKILFDPPASAYVWADEFKTEEVLTNYISNALHHVEGKRQVEIRVRKEETRVRVSVFNTGKPIPEEDLPNLWNKFYKVDKARTREYGGSGIGLSIVKAVMESMNQEYGVKNYDNGVEFWFTLDQKAVKEK